VGEPGGLAAGTAPGERRPLPLGGAWRATIATRLVWWFLCIALVPLALVTYLLSATSEESLRKAVTNHVRAVAEAKANQIETYARERRRSYTFRRGRRRPWWATPGSPIRR